MRALWELARHQLGLITRRQALQLVTIDRVRHLLEQGMLRRVRRGVFAVGGMPPTYEQAVLAVILAAMDDAWASHRTAAKLWGLRVPPPDAIDILTATDRRLRLDGVQHHRNQLIVVGDVTRHGGVPVTSVARTLVDCQPWLPGRALASAVDDACRRGLVDIADLEAAHAAVDEGPRTGRHLVRPLRPVLALRLEGQVPGGSDRELDVLATLAAAGLPLPVQQFEIVVAGRKRYLDYAYPDARLFLEFDGFGEHGLIRSVFDDDRDRNGELALMGWLCLQFTSSTTVEVMVSRVARALALRATG